MSRTIKVADLILTENAELEVVSVDGDALEVVDEHNDHFAQDRGVARTNVMRGTWDLHKAATNE